MRLQFEPDDSMPHFTIQGTFPSLNEYLSSMGRNPHVGNKLKQQYMMIVVNAIRKQIDRRYKAENPIIIHYRLFEPNKRKDHDNAFCYVSKVTQDALQSTGVIPNDGWANVINFTHDFFLDRKNPRIEVYLEEVK